MQPEPAVLFRRDQHNENEFGICSRVLRTHESRCACNGRLVVGRYSVLPFYRELERDLDYVGSRLVNSYQQHRWIANYDYYGVVGRHMSRSWSEHEFPRSSWPGPFIVKGKTNSRKHRWNQLMFAPTRQDAIQIAARLKEDELIAAQGIIYREYVPLRTFEIGLNGLPFANEWRNFYLGQQRLCSGYYWSEAQDVTGPQLGDGLQFADRIAREVSKYVNFFVLDVAQKQDGSWMLIEVNDGQMSGLSMCDPTEFYNNLKEALRLL